MDEAREEIRAAGGDVVCVFQYRAQPTRNFCRQRGVELECLGDPERDSFKAVGLEEGSLREILGPQLVKGFVRAGRKGSLPGLPVGETKQRPGTFVIAPDGTVAFAHYNADSGDHPAMDAMLDAIRSAAGASA